MQIFVFRMHKILFCDRALDNLQKKVHNKIIIKKRSTP